MNIPIDQKLALISEIVGELDAKFSIKTMKEHARSLADKPVKILDYEKQPA